MKTKTYAAYASNANLEQMAGRCPNAEIVGVGFINDYKLTFRCSGYANIEKSDGDKVPVLVWKINEAHEEMLDFYEGYPGFYVKTELPVDMGEQRVQAMVYIMNDKARGGFTYPSQRYLNGVRDGYAANGMPPEYLDAALDECRSACDE
ncbi:MAG: gamma-glutamylcyclotransferase [Oscillospiraceae bacterium]|nr:gamma-glutamylcyclotransferase [Oscillospiraceae bacterium]